MAKTSNRVEELTSGGSVLPMPWKTLELTKMIPLAMQDGCHQLNPRPCTEDDFRRLYHAAL